MIDEHLRRSVVANYDRPTDWNEVIADYLKVRDQVTLRDYCKSNKVSFGSFKTRLYKSNLYRSLFPIQPSDFIQAKIIEEKPDKSMDSLNSVDEFKLTFSNKFDLLIPNNFNENALRRLIAVLS